MRLISLILVVALIATLPTFVSAQCDCGVTLLIMNSGSAVVKDCTPLLVPMADVPVVEPMRGPGCTYDQCVLWFGGEVVLDERIADNGVYAWYRLACIQRFPGNQCIKYEITDKVHRFDHECDPPVNEEECGDNSRCCAAYPQAGSKRCQPVRRLIRRMRCR